MRLRWPLLVLLTALACGTETIDRPNIVLIIGDDHGYPDSGFMGNALVRTPHLDRLASEGTVFTTAYSTASVCRPSLVSLLTGLQPYQIDTWLDRRAKRKLDREGGNFVIDLETLPSLLALRGYRSFQAGKHWEGTWEHAGFGHGTKGEDARGIGPMRLSGGSEGLKIGRTTMQPVWRFLEDPAGEPFFLWFAPMLPHRPMDAPDEIRRRYDGLQVSDSARAYYANVSWLDDAVGDLVGKLDALGVLERTLVVYVSDNGWDNAPDAEYEVGRGREVGGVRGKLSMFELGFRTPIVFRWPGRVPAGVVRDDLVSTIDLFPTLLGYAGLVASAGREGIDLRAAIAEGAPLPRRTLYGSMQGALSSAVGPETETWEVLRRPAFFARSDRWHYVLFEPARGHPLEEELYDVSADPLEQRDVASLHPEIARELRRQVEAWRQAMHATLPNQMTRVGEWRSPEPAGERSRAADRATRSSP
jgi:uncharacterized sulfatase